MRILDARFADDLFIAFDDAIIDMGVSPEEAIPGLMIAVRDQLEKLSWDTQGQAWDEALALLEDDNDSLDEGD